MTISGQRAELLGKPAIRILVDRNIEVHALRAESVAQSKTIKWGHNEVRTTVHGYRGKALPMETWLHRQIHALPTIARLVRQRDVELCTSTELRFESFNASPGWQGSIGDLFRDIRFTPVPPAVERSFFHQTVDVGEYGSGAAQAKWYREFLLQVDEEMLVRLLGEYDALPDFDRKNFGNLGRFRALCEHLDTDDHVRDAFHLWTAEVNDLDYFLTTDKKFINKMTKSTPLELPTPPIAPADFLEGLGISNFDRQPLADGRFRHLLEPDA